MPIQSGDNHSQHHYLINPKAGNGGQQGSTGGPQYKLAPSGGVNSAATGNVSSLPPIVSAGQGNANLNQSKFVDPKTGRTMNQSSNQQKKRKKYKMNYAQQVGELSLMISVFVSLIVFLFLFSNEWRRTLRV